MAFGVLLYALLLFLLAFSTFSKKPIITHGVAETFGYENQMTSLQCRVRNDGPVVIDWYRNESKLSETLEYRIESTKLSDDIIISELFFRISRKTVGAYYCNSSNEFGWTVSSLANVFIAFMEEDFIVEPQSKAPSIGETVILLCEPPSGSPKPVVIWYKDGKEVELSSRIQIVDGTSLRIEKVAWVDSGIYFCVAKSPAFEKSSKKAYLHVRQRPLFLVAPESQSVPVNGIVEFACRVSGEPLPTLTWRRDPPVPAISTTRSMLLADGSLKLMNIQLEDAGDYVCQASNDGGVIEAVARLTIRSPPGFVETPPGNAVFLEGTRAQLVCLATGLPVPEIRWINQRTSEYYLNWIKSFSQRITVTKTGSLIFSAVRISDSGTYECRASSPIGFTRTVIHLFVQPNPHLFPGRIGIATKSVFISPLKNMNELRLVCSAPNLSEFYGYMASGTLNATEVGSFNPFTTFKGSWYKDKMAITLSASSNERFRSDAENSLIIKPVHHSDVGNYSCMVLGMMNKRVAFWHIPITSTSLTDRFSKLSLASEAPPPPFNVTVLGVGDTWISLTWDYESLKGTDSDVEFQVFYLLQFHNSTYLPSHHAKPFNLAQVVNDPNYQDYKLPVDFGTVNGGQYPIDVWESAVKSTRERRFRLAGLLPDSGYWVEVRASNLHLWSRGALVNHIVYTAQSTPSNQASNTHPLEPGKAAEDFQDLSTRVNSIMFLGVSARSLSASEMFISWAVQPTNGAIGLVDGFQIVAKPVFMSRCSARAASHVKDLTSPSSFGVKQRFRLGYNDMIPPTTEQAHCSFSSKQLIERFRQASVNTAHFSSGNVVPEKFLIVSRIVSRESPNTGAVIGGLHPFTCYEITVKAFKDDQTYGRIWSRETPAKLVLSLDSAPSEAPQLISAHWLSGTAPQNMFHFPFLFGNVSYYSSKYPITSSAIRIKWVPLDLYLAHGTLIGYSIHLIANDSNYTQSQKVSPDVSTHDLIDLNPNVEYTIFLAGITCRGEGVRGPGYRMPIFGRTVHPPSSVTGSSSKTAPFPVWAYGAVSGILIAWLLIGCLFVTCLRRHKSQHASPGYCCFGTPSTTKPIKRDQTAFKMYSRKGNNSFISPVNTSGTKSSHTITTTTEVQDYPPSTSHSAALLKCKASCNGSGVEVQRLLKGVESSCDPTMLMLNSSSASSPTNTTSNQDCFRGHGLPLTAGVPYLTGVGSFQPATPPGAYNMINSLPGFSSGPPDGRLLHYEAQQNDPQLQNSTSSRSKTPHEVPPYASSNVLPPEMNQSSWNPATEVDHSVNDHPTMPAGVVRPIWTNQPLQQQQHRSPVSEHAAMSTIPPPPPYPPPPLPSGGKVVAPLFSLPSVPSHPTNTTTGTTQEALRHLSDDGSLPSGGSYLSGYYAAEGCQVQHHSPYSLQHQQQQFHLSVDPRQTSSEQSAAAGGGTSGGSSSLSSHHLRSPPLVHHPRYQPFATCASLQPQTHSQQQRGGLGGSAGSSGHSIMTSHSPALVGPHGYMTGGTASSNDSATSVPPNFPPSARDSCLMQAGHLAMKSTSNSSGSQSSGRPFLPTNITPSYHTTEHVYIQPPLGLANTHYEHRLSIEDNMTYSEVNSTTDMREADNEEEDEETDFDEIHSCSVYGQISSIGKSSLSHPMVLNQPRSAMVAHHSSASESPKLLA
ncbi:roundabout 2 [Echinococcus multilocularis]|uniref:Roundabout 2 n=1 Tax=Echinococcus multilocularis TaxID=6211 RepID=A0A068Y6T6_ECHMU|nr:roundabout 2 [Echinococcus multilocularis]